MVMHARPIALGFLAATAASLLFFPESNATPANPSALVTELSAQVKFILGDAALTPIERQQRFRVLLDQDFDFPTISRFVLGPYWQRSSDSFHQEFTGVFEDYIIQSLSSDLARYDGASIDITGARVEGDRGSIVSSTITHPNGGPPDTVDWHIQNTRTGYKIADVNIAGVSIATAYRDQFAAVIDHNGGQVAALIPDLRQKLDNLASGSLAAGTQGNEHNP
jgi:phospholipid transport system substrate-binding protein